MSIEDDSDSDFDDADYILFGYKTLLTHPQGICRGIFMPYGHLRGFGAMHYEIESFSIEIYIDNWNQDKFYGYVTYIYYTDIP